jgi:hypothetical protein
LYSFDKERMKRKYGIMCSSVLHLGTDVLSHLTEFLIDVKSVRALALTCKDFAEVCYSSKVKAYWFKHFLKHVPDTKMRTSIRHMVSLMHFGYERMAGGLSVGRCEGPGCHVCIDELLYPLCVALCPKCLREHTVNRYNVPLLVQKLLRESLKTIVHVNTGKQQMLFHTPIPSVVPAMSTLLPSIQQFGFSGMDDMASTLQVLVDQIVKEVLTCIQERYRVRLGCWVDAAVGTIREKIWPLLRNHNFENPFKWEPMVDIIATDPKVLILLRDVRYDNLIHAVGYRRKDIIRAIIPGKSFDPLLHTMSYVRSLLVEYDTKVSIYMKRQLRLPTAFRYWRKNRLPWISSASASFEYWVNSCAGAVEDMQCQEAKQIILNVLHGVDSWNAKFNIMSSQIMVNMRATTQNLTTFTLDHWNFSDTACNYEQLLLQKLLPNIRPTSVYKDIQTILPGERYLLLMPHHLQIVAAAIQKQRYKQLEPED